MDETSQKNNDFMPIYNRSHRLAAAVFMISNIMDNNEELRTRIRSLSLELVSLSVNLKDIHSQDAKRLVSNLEKNSLELMSLLDIASLSGMISKMNGDILKEEFQSFVSELAKFSYKFENDKNVSVRSIFMGSQVIDVGNGLEKIESGYSHKIDDDYKNDQKIKTKNDINNGNGHKRKDLRKNTVLEFIKGHNLVSIKDIMPNINGCSEKTIQRELINLIEEGKIKKTGERRWSRYSVI